MSPQTREAIRQAMARVAATWPQLREDRERWAEYGRVLSPDADTLTAEDVERGTTMMLGLATGRYPEPPGSLRGCILHARMERKRREQDQAQRPEEEPDPVGIDQVRALLARMAAERGRWERVQRKAHQLGLPRARYGPNTPLTIEEAEAEVAGMTRPALTMIDGGA